MRAERGEHVRVDEVPRPRAPRRGGDQEIGPRRELEETGEIAIGGTDDRRPGVIADFHGEAARGALCNPASDSAETEHPQALACNDRGLDPPVLLPAPGTDEAISL